MHLTRRQFTKGFAAAAGVAASCSKSFGFTSQQLRLGLNTYSLRTLPHDTAIATVIRVMKEQQLQHCELWSTHVEPQFGPVPTPSSPTANLTPPTPQQLEERKAAAAARSDWRLSVPMSHFENIRSQFEEVGLQIKAYAASFGNSEAELDRLFLMAKALGAQSVNGRVSASITDKCNRSK